jgi:hypothetical protein
MGIDREGFLPESGVEHHVGGFAADSWKRLQVLARPRDLAAVVADERLR